MARSVAGFLDRVTQWAAARDDVRGLILIGSQARATGAADRWSDVDLILAAADPARFLDRSDWLDALGEAAITFVESTPIGGQRERRVLFADGLDVDFSIVAREDLRPLLAEPEVAAVFASGHRFLVDKEGLRTAVEDALALQTGPAPLDQAGFDATVADFWYHAVWTARKLARGELWTATLCCNGYLKRLLMRVLTSQMQLRGGALPKAWYGGRFFERWADPTAQEAFGATVSAYDEAALRRALSASMDLFAVAARDVAARRGLLHRDQIETAARQWVSRALEGPRGG